MRINSAAKGSFAESTNVEMFQKCLPHLWKNLSIHWYIWPTLGARIIQRTNSKRFSATVTSHGPRGCWKQIPWYHLQVMTPNLRIKTYIKRRYVWGNEFAHHAVQERQYHSSLLCCFHFPWRCLSGSLFSAAETPNTLLNVLLLSMHNDGLEFNLTVSILSYFWSTTRTQLKTFKLLTASVAIGKNAP